MSYLFVVFWQNFVLSPVKNTHLLKILKWYRYTDDVFYLYQGDANELREFLILSNSFNCNLNLTMDYSYIWKHSKEVSPKAFFSFF